MRKTYSLEFKAKLVMEVFRGERLLNEIASENNLHPNMLTRWKIEASNDLHVLFENENAKMRKQAKRYGAQIEELYTQIGKLTAQYEWMKKIWDLISIEMKGSPWWILLTLLFQYPPRLKCWAWTALLCNYKPRPSSEWDLQLNRLIDITYTKHPEIWIPPYHSMAGQLSWSSCR